MPTPLSFYEHARQGYGTLPLNGDDTHEWHVGGYTDGGGQDGRGEFRLGLWVNRARESWHQDKAFVRLTAYPDAAEAVADFIAAGGLGALLKVEGPDDVTAALLRCGLIDRSEYAERVQPCPCCIGMGKIRADERAAVEGVLRKIKS